jgi:hypothetical protein
VVIRKILSNVPVPGETRSPTCEIVIYIYLPFYKDDILYICLRSLNIPSYKVRSPTLISRTLHTVLAVLPHTEENACREVIKDFLVFMEEKTSEHLSGIAL